MSRGSNEARVGVVAGRRDVLEMQRAVEGVHVDESVLECIAAIARVTMQHRELKSASALAALKR